MTDELIQRCLAAGRALTAADKATYHAFHSDAPCKAQHRRELAAARTAYREALQAVREAIAAERGWRVSRNTFYIGQLTSKTGAGMGHVEHLRYDRHLDCFRTRERPCKPVAVVSHNYATPEQIERFAKAHGLAYELLPRSWSDPRHRAVLFMRKDA